LLHVLTPPSTELPDVSTHAGNIEVCGDVGNLTAAVSGKGDIKARGANGDVRLTTEQGSITADILSGHAITARAIAEGNIDIRAEEAVVTAATNSGNIRFYGSLHPGAVHRFTVTDTGNIHVAVPAYPDPAKQIIYRITTSDNPVQIDYPALGATRQALSICGFIHGSGPYDYHVENTAAPLGRIEISPVITGAYFFTGTLAASYFRFDTNQTRVSFYTPITQSIHIYTAAQLNQITAGKAGIAKECEAAVSDDLAGAIVINLATKRGLVYVHHRLMPTN
jgi:hypothetical protein